MRSLQLIENIQMNLKFQKNSKKKKINGKREPIWYCAICKSFCDFGVHETRHFVYSYYSQLAILLWKCGRTPTDLMKPLVSNQNHKKKKILIVLIIILISDSSLSKGFFGDFIFNYICKKEKNKNCEIKKL